MLLELNYIELNYIFLDFSNMLSSSNNSDNQILLYNLLHVKQIQPVTIPKSFSVNLNYEFVLFS